MRVFFHLRDFFLSSTIGCEKKSESKDEEEIEVGVCSHTKKSGRGIRTC